MIDQLRRKKFLERLSQPSQVDRDPAEVPSVDDEQVAETITPPQLQIDDTYRDEPKIPQAVNDTLILPRVNRAKEKADNITGDMMVGASHALIGLLSGNKNRMAMEMSKGNKYVQDRAKEDVINTKNLVKTSQDGKPIFTPAKEAVDMEAYQAPIKQGGANNKTILKEFELVDNPNITRFAYVDPNTLQITDSVTNKPLDMNQFQPKQQIKQITSKDQFGNISNSVVRRAGESLNKTKLEAGEGDAIKIPVPKIREGEKVATNYVKRAAKYQEDLSAINLANSILSDPNSSNQEKKLAIGQVIKEIEPRMTDADRSEYKGDASMLVNIGNTLDMTTDNEIPPQAVNAFKQASNNMRKKIAATSGAYRESIIQGYSGKDKGLRDYISQNLNPVGVIDTYSKSAPKKSFKQEPVDQKSIGNEAKARTELAKKIDAELRRRHDAKNEAKK